MALPPALTTAPIGPTLLRLAAPNIIAMFVGMITLVAEAWYVGRLGTTSLAGLALAFPMMMLLMFLSAGSIGGAITGAVAQRLGAGDRSGAESLAFHAVLLAVLLAAFSALVFLGGGQLIYSALGGSGAVLEQALAYSDVLFLGCVTVWLANCLAAIVRATGQMKVAAKNLVAGSVVHVIAAAVLIVGPFYAFFGLALCLYFASLGAGRVLVAGALDHVARRCCSGWRYRPLGGRSGAFDVCPPVDPEAQRINPRRAHQSSGSRGDRSVGECHQGVRRDVDLCLA